MLKIIVTVCNILAPSECHDVVVALDQPMQACNFAQFQIAEWMKTQPGYRVTRWRCDIGDRV